jgi:hypothetical protein
MLADQPPVYATAAEAVEAAVERFNNEAIDWVGSPLAINRFYLQPFTGGLGVMVFGSSLGLPNTKGHQVASARVVGSFVFTRDIAIQMAAFLQTGFGVTEQEMAVALGNVPANFKPAPPEAPRT